MKALNSILAEHKNKNGTSYTLADPGVNACTFTPQDSKVRKWDSVK